MPKPSVAACDLRVNHRASAFCVNDGYGAWHDEGMSCEQHGLAAGPRGECSARLRVARGRSAQRARTMGAEFLWLMIANDLGSSCLPLPRAVTYRPRENVRNYPALLTIAAASTISPVVVAERAVSIDAAACAAAELERRAHGEAAAPLIAVDQRELASFDQHATIEASVKSVARRLGVARAAWSVASVSHRSTA